MALILHLCLFGVISCVLASSTPKTELRRQLLADYDKLDPPSGHVDVHIAMALQSLAGVDDRNERVTLDLVMRAEWTDNRLVIPSALHHNFNDSGAHNGTTFTVLNAPPTSIWTPPLKVLQVLPTTSQHRLLNDDQLIVNTLTGQVEWMGRLVGPVLCKMDPYYFPFDRHHCPLTLHHYDMMDETVQFHPMPILPFLSKDETIQILRRFVQANAQSLHVADWQADVEHIHDLMTVEDVPGFRLLTYNVYLSRRPYRSIFISFVPAIVLSSVGVCAILRWSHPSDRFGFGATLCVALTIMLIGLGDRLPLSERTGLPLVARTYLILFGSVIAALVASGVSGNEAAKISSKRLRRGGITLAVLLAVQALAIGEALLEWYMAE